MAPRNPWKLLRTRDLSKEQLQRLQQKLKQREDDLRNALIAVERALVLVSKSLSQTGKSKYSKKTLRKVGSGRKKTRGKK